MHNTILPKPSRRAVARYRLEYFRLRAQGTKYHINQLHAMEAARTDLLAEVDLEADPYGPDRHRWKAGQIYLRAIEEAHGEGSGPCGLPRPFVADETVEHAVAAAYSVLMAPACRNAYGALDSADRFAA